MEACMKRAIATLFLAASCLSAQSVAQPTHSPDHIPGTRVGQVSPEVVTQLLHQHGFSDVTNLRLDGTVYRAEATKGGARVNVEVDGHSGRLLKP
jgi:hypothetical protein